MSNLKDYEFVDRYDLLNIPHPSPETMCKGQCEGMGIYPQFLAGPWLASNASRLVMDEIPTKEEIKRWHEAHAASRHRGQDADGPCDGWHFITCPDCNGTGKQALQEQEAKQS